MSKFPFVAHAKAIALHPLRDMARVLRRSALPVPLALAAAACLLSGCGRRDDSGDVLVVVNGQPITRGEWRERLRREHGAEALRRLVDRSITEAMAKAQGIVPDEKRVEYKLEQSEITAGGKGKLEENLAKEGRTYDDLRRDLAQQALMEQVLAAQVEVTDDEIRAYYDGHKADFTHGDMIKGRFILLETRKNAEAIYSVLDDPGADFAGLAKALSIDPGTKDDGGGMGWIERGDYAREITDAAFKCKAGEHTGIIEYADGYGIVLVEDKKPGSVRPLDEVRDEIRSIAQRQKESALRPTWAAEQRKKADIKVLANDLREPFERIRHADASPLPFQAF